jgi:RNA polymerase sigma factor (sigma-70 family)
VTAEFPEPAASHPRPAAAPDRDAGPAGTAGPTAADHADFAAFYRSAYPRLMAFLLYLGASPADAGEVAQDTMTLAFQNWPAIRNPNAWSRTVAGRGLVRRVAAVAPEDPAAEPPEPVPSLAGVPDQVLEWEQRHDILRLVRGLPPRQRQVMAWTLDGYTPAEIADALGLSPEAVRQNLHRARTALATRLAARRGEATRDA